MTGGRARTYTSKGSELLADRPATLQLIKSGSLEPHLFATGSYLLNLSELVVETANGLDIAGILGIRLYPLADVLNMDVGGAGLAEEVAPIEVAHDLLPAVHPPRMCSPERSADGARPPEEG